MSDDELIRAACEGRIRRQLDEDNPGLGSRYTLDGQPMHGYGSVERLMFGENLLWVPWDGVSDSSDAVVSPTDAGMLRIGVAR